MTSLSDLLAEPEAGGLCAEVWVEAKDRLALSEAKRQAMTLALIRRIAPRVLVFAIPNATQHGADKLRQYREGAVYGAVDLVFTWTAGIAFLEMKAGRTMPRANQVEFLNRLARQEHHVGVGRTAVGVANWLRDVCGAPIPEIR